MQCFMLYASKTDLQKAIDAEKHNKTGIVQISRQISPNPNQKSQNINKSSYNTSVKGPNAKFVQE